MWHNIPKELQILDQWCCSGPNKIPLNPRTGEAADPTNPETWATFTEACRAGMQHVGIMLSPLDPYVVIDLDDPNKMAHQGQPAIDEAVRLNSEVLRCFPSYSEVSQSGRGVHIIIKGEIPKGYRRDTVEVYGAYRYMICTGNILNPYPIIECQFMLDQLISQMKERGHYDLPELVQVDSILTDEQIYNMASTAANAEKFNMLWSGNISGYPSQSEADFALLSMLAFYSCDNEQVRRLFRYSALGKREKAQKNDRYIDLSLLPIRAKQPQRIDLTNLLANLEQQAQQEAPESPQDDEQQEEIETVLPVIQNDPVDFPPGIIGDIARYVYATAIRPVPEVALAAGIALTAGIIGRSYNISGVGLNQYIILLAKTGTGKEGAVSGIDALIAAIRPQVPMVDQFVGPGAFASGQALVRVIDERPCFVSVLGEFGLTLQQLCAANAQPAQVMLKRVLLDLYSKSGFNKFLRSSAYSDSEKNTKTVKAPSVTLLGESTPETFFEGLDSNHIAEGLIPRFMIIEYTGNRPARNHTNAIPPDPLLCRKLVELVTIGLTTQNNQTCANVPVEKTAGEMLDKFDLECDRHINSSNSEVETQLWNRAHLKALKLAALIAVGCNPLAPCVTWDIAEWAIKFIQRDVKIMLRKFTDGEIGIGDHRQEADVKKAITAYINMSKRQRFQYKISPSIIDKPIIPYHYLRRRLRLYASFKNDRRGANKALEETLRVMVKAQILEMIPAYQVKAEFGLSTELYVAGPTW